VADADTIIAHLALEPHPEGGWFRETWRHEPQGGGRGAGSAIYFMLQAGERSHWHRVDADEIWHFHAGAPLVLLRAPDDASTPEEAVLGGAVLAGEEPQLRVPAGWWQAAHSTGDWTLVSCTVSPAFEFPGFELAAADFEPGA
jgi:hypothetical protein